MPVRAPRRPRPCAYADTPPSASRCRCGGRASSTPLAAIASPVPLSAVVALRWSQGSVSPASVPPAVSWPGAPFPQRGPSGRFPRVVGSMRRSDSLPPVPPRFVTFAGRYHGRTRVSFPWPPGAPAAGLELVTRYLRPGGAVEAAGPPRFLGNPRERIVLSDPGGIAHARPLRRRDAAFRSYYDVGSRKVGISGLHHTTRSLAVSASQPGSPRDHARLASGCWPGSAGRGWLPAGFR
jgi:hypothetical protein